MPPQLAVVNGAILKCDKGTTPSPLVVTTSPFVQISARQIATIGDNMPLVNVFPFGICSITQKPCVPITPLPWHPGGIGIPTGSPFLVLPKNSLLGCMLGGFVEVKDAAQTTVIVDAPPTNKTEAQKYKIALLAEQEAEAQRVENAAEEDEGPGFLKKAGGFVLDMTPFVGTGKGIGEAFKGEDLVTGEKLSPWERALGVVPYGKAVKKGVKGGKAGYKAIKGAPIKGKKLPNDEIHPPPKRGNAPISKKDDKPIELHHRGQKPDGPVDEMHPSDHRYGKNQKKNHPNTGQKPSAIDRKEFKKWRKKAWEEEWDSGRFEGDDKNDE